MRLDIDFEWQRDSAGYDLLPAAAGKPRKPEPRPLFGPISIFPPADKDPDTPARVIRRGGSLVTYRPFEDFGTLCMTFASIAKSEEGVVDFISNFGPLTKSGHDQQHGQPVPEVLECASVMWRLLKRSEKAPRALFELMGVSGRPLTNVEVRLVGDPGVNSLRLRLRPRSLLDALWLQLGLKLSGGGAIRECELCGGWFEAGPGTGRRLDAKFCSDAHRVTFNSLQRSRSAHKTKPRKGL